MATIDGLASGCTTNGSSMHLERWSRRLSGHRWLQGLLDRSRVVARSTQRSRQKPRQILAIGVRSAGRWFGGLSRHTTYAGYDSAAKNRRLGKTRFRSLMQ